MVERGSYKKAILLADRGYAVLNLLEHIHRKPNLEYLIRTKNGWISEVKALPLKELDVDISFELRTTQRLEDLKAYKEGKAKLIYAPSKFGKEKKLEQWESESPYRMKLRIVRFRISNTGNDANDYETIVTSLDRTAFPLEEIKCLYHLRWGIETSFRELKYVIGLRHIHTKKDDVALQEIYARLIMYNFCECITMAVIIEQKDSRKWVYQVNYTYAIYICKDYFRCHDPSPPDVISRISSEILPVRPGRQDLRKISKRKDFVWFVYRVS